MSLPIDEEEFNKKDEEFDPENSESLPIHENSEIKTETKDEPNNIGSQTQEQPRPTLFKMDDIPDINDQKAEEEDKVGKIISYFKKINIKGIAEINEDHYDKEKGWFHCGKLNKDNGNKCEVGKEICPNCMKRTQKLYNLKPHYLINSHGRICTYKNKKIYCLGKLNRIESETKSKEDKKSEIKYSIAYSCGHSGQCEPCKNLTKIMDKYFDTNLMNKLIKRDETNLN